MDREIVLHAWCDRDAQCLMERLCQEIEPRPAGSTAIRRAREVLSGELTSMDAVGIHEEEVPVRFWYPGEPHLELLSPQTESYPCVQCLFTPSVDNDVPLVHVGAGTGEDFTRLGPQVQGSAVLMDGHAISGGKFVPLQARVALARKAGAKAIILRSMSATSLPAVEVVGIEKDADLPCVSVSRETGDALAKATKEKARVLLHANGSSEPAVCANLIADLGPANLPEEMIVLGAHLDSFWNAPGALDNLTGVVTAFEVARLLAPSKNGFRRTLRLVFYTGEELGFLGSKSYVARHKDELDRTSFVVNMDSLFAATSRGMAVMWSPEMREYIDQVFIDAGRQVDVRNLFCMSSDYLPFMLQGIPASRPADWEDSMPIWSHTEGDDLSHVRIDWIQHNAMVYAQLLGRMLTDPQPLPAKHLPAEEIRRRLEDEDVVDSLKLMGLEVA